MVEGGLIDYAGHENDAGAMLAEIVDFDEAVGVGFDFARSRDDTLVLVTADHGTGGFSFTYGPGGPGPFPTAVFPDYSAGPEMAGVRHLEMLAAQRRSLIEAMPEVSSPATAESVLAVIEEATGIRLTGEEAADLAEQLNAETAAPPRFRDLLPRRVHRPGRARGAATREPHAGGLVHRRAHLRSGAAPRLRPRRRRGARHRGEHAGPRHHPERVRVGVNPEISRPGSARLPARPRPR